MLSEAMNDCERGEKKAKMMVAVHIDYLKVNFKS
jgi:hypothetical protein